MAALCRFFSRSDQYKFQEFQEQWKVWHLYHLGFFRRGFSRHLLGLFGFGTTFLKILWSESLASLVGIGESLWISDVKLLVWDDIIVSNREPCLLQCVFFFLTFPEVLEWGGQDGLVFVFLEEWTKINTGLTFGNATFMSHLIWAWKGNTWWKMVIQWYNI